MSHCIRKQLLPILLVVVLTLSLAVAFTACNNQHEHTYSTEWAADADYHWHEATCNDTREVKDRGQHSFNEDGRCTVCNYQHEHTFSKEWKNNGTYHWHEATCEHEDEKSDMNAHAYGEDGKCTVCGYEKPVISEHQHSYSEQWTTDSDYHWHEATCEHEDEINDLGAHSYGNDGKCTVCGHEKPAKPEHEHTYSEWLGDEDGENHYKLPTCGDTDEMIGPFPHEDEDGDGVCDVCLTTNIHKHSFSTEWSHDNEGHWKAATCKHYDLKSEYSEHVDEDDSGYGDGVCDICGYSELPHEHKFEEEWTINESVHWHVATCVHFMEKGNYASHSFNAKGVCVCGVEKSYVEVYDLYTRTGNLTFVEWLRWLEDKGVVRVEKTESGDGIYYYEDATYEIAFLGDRTVKVKAEASGEPLAHVWIMISLYDRDNEGYVEVDGTIALGLAETNKNGIAEITFSPVGGYSSDIKEYRVRIAERKDIAHFQGVAEENTSKPIPNRYEVKGGQFGFEYMPYEVSENGNGEGIAVTIEFTYSNGWYAYNKFTLSYHRFFEDLINGEGIKEEGFTYEFMSSGGNLFDYFYFSPAKYSFASSGSLEDSAKIEENAKLAAAGIYKISFTVEGDTPAELYYWNEEGVILDAFHYAKSDGSPSDRYITSQSGGTEGSGKYTGGSFVEVKIAPSLGLRYYQLGIKTDVECKVKITVERTSDYGIGPDYIFDWDESGISELTVDLPQTEKLTFGLNGVPVGLYTFTLPLDASKMSSSVGRFYAWTDTDEQKICVWAPRKYQDVYGVNKAVITITENTKYIYLQNLSVAEKRKVVLEAYELPEVNSSEFAAVPVTPLAAENSYTMSFSAPAGKYQMSVWIANIVNGGKDMPLTVHIGDKVYEINQQSTYVTAGFTFHYYIGSVEVGEQDATISFRCSTEYSFTAGLKLDAVA